MMKSKIFFLMAMFVASVVFGSTIPTYQICTVGSRLITIDNNAVFELGECDSQTVLGWEAADELKFIENRDSFRPEKVVIIDGRVVICPAFYLRNATRNNEQVAVLLNVAPSILLPNTPSISSIDAENRIITLSDATRWTYPSQVAKKIASWNEGQLVMIGCGSTHCSCYDAVLFNGMEQISIPVHEL